MKLISKALRMARVKGIAQFYLPHTRLSTNGNESSCFYSQPQSIIALWPYSFPVPQRVEAELAWVAGCTPRWYVNPKTVTHPSTNRPIVRRPRIEFRALSRKSVRPVFKCVDGGWQRMNDSLVAEVESNKDRRNDVAESAREDDVILVKTERDHPVS